MGVTREFEGMTVDEALHAASDALGVPVGELHYDLLDEGRRGVFGLGMRQVRIRVEVPERAADAPVAEGEPPAEPLSPAQRSVEQTLERMLRLMGLKLRVRSDASGKTMRLHLSGPDRRMLVHKDAQLLTSLQFVLNRMSRRAWPDVGRIQLMCDGYRNRRDEDLVELVREVASQVSRTGQAKQLHPMNPYERRLAHLTVREFSGLTSRSEGEGFLKKVVVAPAGAAGGPAGE